MSLPPDSPYPPDALVGTKVADIALRDCEARVSQLLLDIAKVRSILCKLECTRVTTSVYVDSMFDPRDFRSTLEHTSCVRIMDALTTMRAEVILALRTYLSPWPHKIGEFVLRNSGDPALAAFATYYRHGTPFPPNITRAEIERLIAPKLGVEVDGEQGTISDSSSGGAK